jgi:DNA-binding NarL/FixJ family response regulator
MVAMFIGFTWLACIIAFVIAAIRAPTLEYMSDEVSTDEMVAALREVVASGRAETSVDGPAVRPRIRNTG